MRVCPGLFMDQAQVEGNCFWESLMTEMGKLNSAHSRTVTALLWQPSTPIYPKLQHRTQQNRPWDILSTCRSVNTQTMVISKTQPFTQK